MSAAHIKPRLAMAIASAFVVLSFAPGHCQVFHTLESALALAFPDAEEVSPRHLILSREEMSSMRSLAGSAPESRLVTVYEGRDGDTRLGWALLDTHVIRTSPETVLLVLDPDGRIVATHILAFHEPGQYQPSGRWLARFHGRELDDELVPGRGVAGIAGSTLTSHAMTAAIRRMLAIWQVKLGGERT